MTTKTAQFTPGPWEVTGPNTCEVVTSNAGTYRPIMTIAKVNGYWDGEALANMRLIAAAPAMYADLCAVRDYLFELYDEGNAKAGEYAASLGITIEQAEGQHHE